MSQLRDIYPRFAEKPLSGELLKSYYAGRSPDYLVSLAEDLKGRSDPHRALILGQVGVGKTTELNRLHAAITGDAAAFLFSLGRNVQSETLGDNLAYVARSLAQASGVANPDVASLLAEGEESNPARAVKAMNLLVEAIGESRLSTPVILLDGAENFGSDLVLELMRAFARVKCSVVLVANLSLYLEENFDSRCADGEWEPVILPAAAAYTRERKPAQAGVLFVKEVVQRRAGDQTFEPPALDLLFSVSGGICRHILKLASYAIRGTDLSQKSVIGRAELEAALPKFRLNHTPSLTAAQEEVLRRFVAAPLNTFDLSMKGLLDSNRIVAYHLDHLWFDVHPALWPRLGIRQVSTGWLW